MRGSSQPLIPLKEIAEAALLRRTQGLELVEVAGEADFIAGLDADEQIPGVRLYTYLTQTVQIACFISEMGNSTMAYLLT